MSRINTTQPPSVQHTINDAHNTLLAALDKYLKLDDVRDLPSAAPMVDVLIRALSLHSDIFPDGAS
jgi:hypothetical protein